MRDRVTSAAALAAVPALAALAPSGSGPDAPLLSAIALVAWACTGWLLLVALLESVSRLPGRVGRLGKVLSCRIAPASVRALVRVALGAGVAATLVAGPVASAALAEDRAPTVAGSASDALDWPGLAPLAAWPTATPAEVPNDAGPDPEAQSSASPDPGPPAASAPHTGEASAPRHVPQPPDAGSETVVVRPGDSLWRIARRSLGPSASDQQVARAWPAWWAANRSVLGDDPGLLHPGDRLTAPLTSLGDS